VKQGWVLVAIDDEVLTTPGEAATRISLAKTAGKTVKMSWKIAGEDDEVEAGCMACHC
jgi:hypothetical protein